MINRYTLKLLGLPIPLFAFQPRPASEDHTLSTQGVYILGVKNPKASDVPKDAYAFTISGYIPVLGEADVDLTEENSYYGTTTERYNPLSNYADTPKISEANIPYLHGELVKFGKIPYASLPTNTSDSFRNLSNVSNFISDLGESKLPGIDPSPSATDNFNNFKNQYNRDMFVSGGSTYSKIYWYTNTTDNTPQAFYEWVPYEVGQNSHYKNFTNTAPSRLYTTTQTPTGNGDIYEFFNTSPTTTLHFTYDSSTGILTDNSAADNTYKKLEVKKEECLFEGVNHLVGAYKKFRYENGKYGRYVFDEIYFELDEGVTDITVSQGIITNQLYQFKNDLPILEKTTINNNNAVTKNANDYFIETTSPVPSTIEGMNALLWQRTYVNYLPVDFFHATGVQGQSVTYTNGTLGVSGIAPSGNDYIGGLYIEETTPTSSLFLIGLKNQEGNLICPPIEAGTGVIAADDVTVYNGPNVQIPGG